MFNNKIKKILYVSMSRDVFKHVRSDLSYFYLMITESINNALLMLLNML